MSFWDMEVSEDGSFRMCEPTGTWCIDFGDQGNLDLVETKHLGRFLKGYALWRLMESEKLLEEIVTSGRLLTREEMGWARELLGLRRR